MTALQSSDAKRALLVLQDGVVIGVTITLTYLFRFGQTTADAFVFGVRVPFLGLAMLIGILWLLALGARESRSRAVLGAGMEEYRRVLSSSLSTFGLVAVLSYLAGTELSRTFFATTLPLGVILLIVGRFVWRFVLRRARRVGKDLAPTLIVGTTADVCRLMADMARNPEAGYRPAAVCLVDAEDDPPSRSTGSVLLATTHSSVDTITMDQVGVARVTVDEIGIHVRNSGIAAVALTGGLSTDETRRLAWCLEDSSAHLMFTPRLADLSGPRIHVSDAPGLGLLHVDMPRFSGWHHVLKRALDVCFSAALLAALAPVFLAIAIAIKLDDGGPVIFRQERIGRGGEPFVIHKFRSMRIDAEAQFESLRSSSQGAGPLFKMEGDPRITRVGAFLRRRSLDELPQFWTVLRGDMSVVGPRPHLARELAEYPADGLRRVLIKPGITGLWQVSGRSDLSLEESVRLDLRYVENWSISGDLAIILSTVKVMLNPRGAY